jgi:PilZ domain
MEAYAALEFLLVSNNYHTLTAVSGGLKQVGASFDFAPTCEAGREYIGRRRVDGVIVDLGVPGAHDLINSIRQGISNRGAVVFACLPKGENSPVAVVTGATYLLTDPLTPDSVAAHVSAARNAMLRERRRYFRYPLSLPVHLTSNGVVQRAMMSNLSEGGMAVYAPQPVEHPTMVEFAFELPSGHSIAGKGSIAWANSESALGIKFVFLRGQGEEILHKWLRERPASAKESFEDNRIAQPG